MKLIVEIEYTERGLARDIFPGDVLLALRKFDEIHEIVAVNEIRPTPVPADAACACEKPIVHASIKLIDVCVRCGKTPRR